MSDLTDEQRDRLFALCFPEVRGHTAEYPVDAALALMDFATIFRAGDGKETTFATHEGQRLALQLRREMQR